MRRRPAMAMAASLLLAVAWVAAWKLGTFAAHMSAHVTGVALAAPLLALAVARPPLLLRMPAAPLVACGVELVVVWGWHWPALHEAARTAPAWFLLEQVCFLLAGYGVWASALPGSGATGERPAALAGVGALLLTSMHMTLLGGLLAVSPGTWYGHGAGAAWDQSLGGVIMLAVGGIAYLAGALVLLARLLVRDPGVGHGG